jgi:hypothetical protein
VVIDDGVSLLRLEGVDAGLLDGWRGNTATEQEELKKLKNWSPSVSLNHEGARNLNGTRVGWTNLDRLHS